MTVRSCINARHLRGLYSGLETTAEAGNADALEIKTLIDDAMQGVMDKFKALDYRADGADSAEEVIGVLVGYFLTSNPSFRSLFPQPPVQVEIVEGKGADDVTRYGWRIHGEPDSDLSDLFEDMDSTEQDARDSLGAMNIERFIYDQ